ncbi:hypothetical protein [Clostridium beijerinckii]|uniref:hypothetical protein n=1 Tax=Clostridium beijerinckii TaxID=1520 RepID=UPI0003D38983|nr:hypothetical protein [Clostridium beijerinckii]ALB45868.1 cytochrome b5 [Clostridium beijerinckii NRRL B-598]
MPIYFDLKTIEENYFRKKEQFKLGELSQHDESNEKLACVEVNGIDCDLSNLESCVEGKHLESKNSASKARVSLVDTYNFSPDDWIGYITPLVNYALEEATGGVSLEHLFQKYIMIGILVGKGMTFDEATNEIEDWETSGISKLLDKSKMTQSK